MFSERWRFCGSHSLFCENQKYRGCSFKTVGNVARKKLSNEGIMAHDRVENGKKTMWRVFSQPVTTKGWWYRGHKAFYKVAKIVFSMDFLRRRCWKPYIKACGKVQANFFMVFQALASKFLRDLFRKRSALSLTSRWRCWFFSKSALAGEPCRWLTP